MKKKILSFILIVGLLSACGSRPTEAPASPPTEEPAPATEAAVDPPIPTDTAIPPADIPITVPVALTGISFANDVLPILNSRCLNCHGGDKIEEGLIMNSYTNLMAGSDNGPIIIPGDAGGSLLVEMVSTKEMPKRGPKLTPPQIQLIVDWVNQGALNN